MRNHSVGTLARLLTKDSPSHPHFLYYGVIPRDSKSINKSADRDATNIHFYGRKHSDKTKELMSNLKKGISTGPFSEEKRANIAKARVGKKWYKNIDSSECVCCYPGCQPEGWIPGMVKM